MAMLPVFRLLYAHCLKGMQILTTNGQFLEMCPGSPQTPQTLMASLIFLYAQKDDEQKDVEKRSVKRFKEEEDRCML